MQLLPPIKFTGSCSSPFYQIFQYNFCLKYLSIEGRYITWKCSRPALQWLVHHGSIKKLWALQAQVGSFILGYTVSITFEKWKITIDNLCHLCNAEMLVTSSYQRKHKVNRRSKWFILQVEVILFLKKRGRCYRNFAEWDTEFGL